MAPSTHGRRNGGRGRPRRSRRRAIELVGIDKRFGAGPRQPRHLARPSAAGTIHGIVGENGAGKSTLMAILYGYLPAPTAARSASTASRRDIRDARATRSPPGSAWCTSTSCWWSRSPCSRTSCSAPRAAPLLRARRSPRARAELERLEQEYELEVDPDALVGDLSVGQQQRVEILKALYRGADILILDEPTAVLTPQEADHLFRILRALRDEGKTSSSSPTSSARSWTVTDAVTVMRRGEVVRRSTPQRPAASSSPS